MKTQDSSEHFDIVIIGGGPIGMACGIEAQKKGLSYAIIEKGSLVNSIYNYPSNMTFFSTSEKLEIGEVPFISHNPRPTRSEALEYFRRVAMHWQLNIRLYEDLVSVSGEIGHFNIVTSKSNYTSRYLVIATGFYDISNKMNIPGEDLPKVHHYYKEPHIYFGQNIVVVGAANSAVDVAMETWRKGAKVTMVIRDGNIRDSVKYWIKPDVENRIEEGSIKAYYHSTLNEIREHEVDISTPDGVISIPNDFVLAMTGYLPDFNLLKSLGIQLGEDEFMTPVHNPDTMQTNIPGIYLAGVICGGLKTNKWFIENSRVHAKQIIDGISRIG